MTDWSLSQLLAGLHDDIQQRLETPPAQRAGRTLFSGDESAARRFPLRYL